MSIVESILYGLISGLTDFLPVSSGAHQALMRYLFGVNARIPFQELLVHIGVIASIFIGCNETLVRLQREQRSQTGPRRRKIHTLDSKSYYDLRLLKTATIPLLIGLFLSLATRSMENNLLNLMAFWLCNAVILLLADHSRRGNRDSRTMSALDGIVMGVLGSLSVFPGISRTAIITSYSALRGADNENAVHWAVLLGVPATFLAIAFDLVRIVVNGFGCGSSGAFLGCILSGITAFGGGYLGISLLKLILNQSGFSKFAYYSIGTALLSFILYLIT